ncbi:TetR/AcrR family transcriptional regulator [Saccharomonospora sp.]|uniref:TetR/AcrR family transcriptional regulator n=1 Tax=Saccharomonospora sp. TaxID=33913 RepID=UPI0026253525|nr:TetR/AcrR family transcriptional regulator [Saccharomonospora sp.]
MLPTVSVPEGRSAVQRRLLSAATRLFAEHGFDRTSVSQIVEAAGVTKGAMYHYFRSKDDLLYEVYARVLREQTRRLEAFASGDEPVTKRLHSIASDVVVSTIANLDDATIFFQSLHRLDPAMRKAVRAERRRYHERFRGLIEEGQRAGLFRSDKPADIIVDFFFGAVHHLAYWYQSSGELSAQQVGDHFADLLLDSLELS